MSASRAPDSYREPSRRIAGRYTVEAELAVGGMGAVYRVHDESSRKVLALKQLLPNVARSSTLLFQKEFHTLVRLRHPRIIAVYDYGISDARPYYTMELLDGEDLRALAPLPFQKACFYLRDVASSLALLHAHRLLHRDLTPRNVRATGDGRCKLLDFGALAPFGTPPVLVGTPPFVPPEAFRGLALDQRADLFSLGALAYYLLTRSHAYPAKSLEELEAFWKKPPALPSARAAALDTQPALEPVPAALDLLVLSLLSLDPLVRPTSAAEVIERLEAIANLKPDPGPWSAAQSYLSSTELVGRAPELERTKTLAAEVVAGLGSVLSFHHASGMGGTRLLGQIGLEARLAGAVVVQVDAEEHRGSYAVARALAAKLMGALPEATRTPEARELRSIGWLDAQGARPSPVDISVSPGLWRMRIQYAAEKWFLESSARHPLVLLVDNLHRADDGSASLLASLGAAAKAHPLAVIATLRTGEAALAPAAVKALVDAGEALTLRELSAADAHSLLRSLFGDVPNLERLAQWLYRLSGGHPLHLTELSQYLVSEHLARYVDGTWILPQELPEGLPARVEEALDVHLDKLTPAALKLVHAFSVHDGSLSLETCVQLAEAEGCDAFSALDELTTEGVLVAQGQNQRLAQGSLRERILQRLGGEEQKRLHRLLGSRLLDATNPDLTMTLQAGWHLFHGGEEERGADVLRRCGLELVDADDIPQALPALEAAIGVYRKLGRPSHELMGLLSPVAFAGFYVDRRLADRYGDETIAHFAEETGLALTARLRPYIGSIPSLLVGLGSASIRHLFGGRGGPRELSHRIAMLGALSSALTGTATLCLDAEGAARRAAVFEPFSVLGRRHAGAFAHAMARRLAELTQDRAAETIAGLKELLAQLETPGGVIGLPDQVRPILKGGILFALGALESFMDAPLALERANQLEATGPELYAMVAHQVRANYHACRGESALAAEYERRVESYAVRSGTAWQAEVWAPSSRVIAFNLTRDVIGLKRTAEELERLAREVPSLSRHARLARATFKSLRGDYASAIPELEAVVAEIEPRGYIGWCAMVCQLSRAYNETGQHQRAEAACRDAIGHHRPADRAIVAMNLGVEIELAMAESGLGRGADAARRLDELLAEHRANEGPVTLGSLHRARARVALGMGDRAALEHHQRAMEVWFRVTKNPALIAECERFAHTLRASVPPPAEGPGPDAVTVVTTRRDSGTTGNTGSSD